MVKIYLAGKMTGLDKTEMGEWRRQFAEKMKEQLYYSDIPEPQIIDPVECFADAPAENAKEYVRWELRHVSSSDIVVTMISQNQDSIGTAVELGAAYANKVPVLLYNPFHIERDKIHPFVMEIGDRVFDQIDALVEHIITYYLY